MEAEAAADAGREVQGVSDRWEALQPTEPPPFDTRLVGKRLEVCWPYKEGYRLNRKELRHSNARFFSV